MIPSLPTAEQPLDDSIEQTCQTCQTRPAVSRTPKPAFHLIPSPNFHSMSEVKRPGRHHCSRSSQPGRNADPGTTSDQPAVKKQPIRGPHSIRQTGNHGNGPPNHTPAHTDQPPWLGQRPLNISPLAASRNSFFSSLQTYLRPPTRNAQFISASREFERLPGWKR